MFRTNNYYFWVPITGPIVGGIIGVWLYQCYVSIIKSYGQLSNTERKSSVEISHKAIKTEDDASELREQLTTTVA